MPYMYILECSDGSFYTGSTQDLPLRLWQHQNGLGANHTKKRLPVKLVYAEYCDRVEDAFYLEKQVQGWSRKKKIALMNSDWDRLHILAECQNESHYQRRQASSSQEGWVSTSLNPPKSKLDSPQLNAPKLDSPQLNALQLNAPKFNAPKFNSPQLNTPKFNAPKLDSPKFNTPKFNSPKLNSPDKED